jgi:hypothetical protein
VIPDSAECDVSAVTDGLAAFRAVRNSYGGFWLVSFASPSQVAIFDAIAVEHCNVAPYTPRSA